jgi:predicted amidophosphoribosyltransferase
MGLFDKKNCDICGEKIGLLGNRKLDDGNLCKNCARKLSPWFEERRHSTVEDILCFFEYDISIPPHTSHLQLSFFKYHTLPTSMQPKNDRIFI